MLSILTALWTSGLAPAIQPATEPRFVVHVRDARHEPLSASRFEFRSQSATLVRRVDHLPAERLAPGDYRVTLGDDGVAWLGDDKFLPSLRAEVRGLGTRSVRLAPEQREVDVVFGEPASLDVRVENAAPADLHGRLMVRLFEVNDGIEFTSGTADSRAVDSDGVASFDSVNAGRYRAVVDCVDDPDGALARAGFEDGDLIIGYDGVEADPRVPGSAFVEPKGPARSKVIVVRGTQRLEFELPRDDLHAQRDLGGRLWPTER